MITAFIAGFFVSVSAILIFSRAGMVAGARRWILAVSRFVYLAGHPVLDDDQIAKELMPRFRAVLGSFFLLLFRMLVFGVALTALVAVAALAVHWIRDGSPGGIRTEILFPPFLTGWPFMAGSLAPLLFLLARRKKPVRQNPYSPVEQFMHYLFLGNKVAAKSIFRLERMLQRRKLRGSGPAASIYVSGMARAGTTVLMQYLAQLPECRSLSYRNMPFVFMPSTWPGFVSKKKVAGRERFHADGIMHDLNSPEALEEPFWLHYAGRRYIRDKSLVRHDVPGKIYSRYAEFRRLIAGSHVYLAKNNNHLLRAGALHEKEAAAGGIIHTVIPFRRADAQAASLLRMHLELGAAQRQDEFVLDYMDMLGHHEFGLHRKVSLPGDPDAEWPAGNPEEKPFWMSCWHDFYRAALDRFGGTAGFYFFCYERFVENPAGSLEALLNGMGLTGRAGQISVRPFQPATRTLDDSSGDAGCDALYDEMKKIAIN